jgi:uncharacterized protein (TIGR02588 family)
MSDTKQQEKSTQYKSNGSSSQEQQTDKHKSSVWEKVTALIGLLLVVSSIGFIIYQALWGNESSPDVKIKIESIQQVSNGYLVEFTSKNQGGSTLAGVVVQGQLKQGEKKIETSQTTIDFIPANSVRKGGFFFKNNPEQYQLEARSLGYQQP